MFSRRSKFGLIGAFAAACFVLVLLNKNQYQSPESLRNFLPRPGVAAPSHVQQIPKKLWFKLGPKGLDEKTRAWSDSCVKGNPHYKATFMTDASADDYVKEKFTKLHPDLVELYLGLTVPILKADLLRYLLLFTEGGVYCDLDVSCHRPIDEWIPPQFKDSAAIVAGWEFDAGWGDNFIRQFATWTIMAKPNSPHMWNVVHDISQAMRKTMRENGLDSPANLTMAMLGDVVDATGPRRFTRSVLDSLERQGSKPDMNQYELIKEPKMLGDLLIQPGWAFAASTNTYEDDYEVPPPLVKHHYAGSWKNEQGGETLRR